MPLHLRQNLSCPQTHPPRTIFTSHRPYKTSNTSYPNLRCSPLHRSHSQVGGKVPLAMLALLSPVRCTFPPTHTSAIPIRATTRSHFLHRLFQPPLLVLWQAPHHLQHIHLKRNHHAVATTITTTTTDSTTIIASFLPQGHYCPPLPLLLASSRKLHLLQSVNHTVKRRYPVTVGLELTTTAPRTVEKRQVVPVV